MLESTAHRLGVIEGFFGKSWSWEARAAYASFLADHHYDAYIYAPKSDPFFRKQWHNRLPLSHFDELVQLRKHYREHKVQFGIGLSPFELYQDFSEKHRILLRYKIEEINAINPSILCILFDDMRGDLQLMAKNQLEIIGFISELSTATSLIICPTYYSTDPRLASVFGAEPKGYLRELGAGLDKAIDVFWTGPRVISSSYPREHLEAVAEQLQRLPTLWDNYPVNDAERLTHHLHLQPFSNRSSALRKQTRGHFCNPMNQAFLSQIPLATLAAIYADKPLTLDQACAAQCSHELATILNEDANLFQLSGLLSMSDAQKQQFTERYQQFQDQAMAQEVLDWLQGHYQFDPACLT